MVQEAKQSILEDVKKQTFEENHQLVEKLKDERDDFRDDFVPKRDFLKEKGFNRRLNLILLGLEEPVEDGDELDNVSTLLLLQKSIVFTG